MTRTMTAGRATDEILRRVHADPIDSHDQELQMHSENRNIDALLQPAAGT